jgi:hypothetical protein
MSKQFRKYNNHSEFFAGILILNAKLISQLREKTIGKLLMKMIIPTAILSLALSLISCTVIGSETETRDVDTFSKLKASGLAEVFITQAQEQQVKVVVSGMPVSDVLTYVEGDTLVVTTQGFHSGESVEVYVNYLQLNSIMTAGSAELTGTNQLIGEQLNVTTSGAGDIKDLDIKVDKLMVSINGAGNADLDVNVQMVEIVMNGAGDLDIQGVARKQSIKSNSSRGTLNNSNLDYSE